MSSTSGLKATSLRGFLAFMLIVSIAGAAAGFYFGLQQIRAFAIETNQTLVDAEASGDQIDQLRQLKTSLEASDSLVQKAQNVFATPDNYQSQAVRELQRYASVAGINIEGTEFSSETEPGGAPTSDRPVEVTIQSPVSYTRLIRFLQLVEGNIPKMQPETVEITRPGNPSGDSVNVSPIIIRMAVQ